MTEQQIDALQQLFDTMQMHDEEIIKQAVARVKAGISHYEALVNGTMVPWYFVGIIHYREGDCDFTTHLHNGDPIRARTVHVPKGRPIAGQPPFTWEESARDALFIQAGFDKLESWSLPEMLERFERYNGTGYRAIGINSPYIWSFTNHYIAGKFTSDGHYNETAIDKQVGCAPLLRYLTDKTLGLI